MGAETENGSAVVFMAHILDEFLGDVDEFAKSVDRREGADALAVHDAVAVVSDALARLQEETNKANPPPL